MEHSIDRDKVISGLEIIRFNLRQMGHRLMADSCDDAIAVLKEREAEISRISNAYLELVGKASKMDEQQYGDWVSMGFLSEDWFVACIPQTAKMLIEQMRRTVVPMNGFSLVFRMEKTDEDGVYHCTGAWKCSGRKEGKDEPGQNAGRRDA